MKDNEQLPTAYQISVGQLIMPRRFYQEHGHRLRGEFTVIAFGKRLEKRRLDQSFRVRIPFMKDHMTTGDRASVRMGDDGILYVDRVESHER